MRRTQRTIAVKPTVYRGVQMRSRAEARVAEMLDQFGLRWIYEPEALMGDVQYTPDFYLPEIDTLVEVKPAMFEWEIKRVKGVVEQFKKTFVVLEAEMGEGLRIIDIFGPLQGCDGFAPGNPCKWGWHSSAPDDRNINFDADLPLHPRKRRFYIGSGCHWLWLNGCDCSCTR